MWLTGTGADTPGKGKSMPEGPSASQKQARSTPDGPQRQSHSAIEELSRQDVTSARNGMSYLEANRLLAPGGAPTTDALASTLFQVTMLPGIRADRASVDMI